MQIVDNQDMTISIWVFPEVDIASVSLELIAAIKQGYLTLRRRGVGRQHSNTGGGNTIRGKPLFGFDMDNEYITGFDAGAWGTLL
jgi:hypothetical protein